MNETPLHAHEANLIPSSEPPLFDGHSMKVACSNCNLRELCMPVGLSPHELARIDEVELALLERADHFLVPQPREAPPRAVVGDLEAEELGAGGDAVVDLAVAVAVRAVGRAVALVLCRAAVEPFGREARREREAALEAGAPDCIATANIGCISHLQGAAGVPVRHWIELLDEALERRIAS